MAIFLGGNFSGDNLPGGNYPGGNRPGGNLPSTVIFVESNDRFTISK